MAAATCYELVVPMRPMRGVHAGPQVRRGQPRPPLIHAHYSDQRSAIMVSAISRGVAPTFGLVTPLVRVWPISITALAHCPPCRRVTSPGPAAALFRPTGEMGCPIGR